MTAPGYNFGYLDENTKRMIRRALLKAVAIPGHQVPFGSREMPLPYGWGTGGIQVTAAVIGPDDTLKVIDQGADDTTNAVSIRRFFARVAGVATTERTEDATAPAQQPEFVLYHCDNVEATGFVEHLKLPHYVDFQSELENVRTMRESVLKAAAE